MVRTCILGLLLLLVNKFTISAEAVENRSAKFPTEARQALESRYPSLIDEVQFAEGDVDGDGIFDIAAIIRYVAGGTEMESVVVLKGRGNGGFTLLAESIGIESHHRRSEFVGIKNGTISVVVGAGTYTEYAGTEYKFKVYAGTVLLIGMESSEGTIGEAKPSYRLSANFLTNRVILTSWRESARKPRVSERHLRGDHKIPLGKFSLDGAMDAELLK